MKILYTVVLIVLVTIFAVYLFYISKPSSEVITNVPSVKVEEKFAAIMQDNSKIFSVLPSKYVEVKPRKLEALKVGESVSCYRDALVLDRDGKCWIWTGCTEVIGEDTRMRVTRRETGWDVKLKCNKTYKWNLGEKESYLLLKCEPVLELSITEGD